MSDPKKEIDYEERKKINKAIIFIVVVVFLLIYILTMALSGLGDDPAPSEVAQPKVEQKEQPKEKTRAELVQGQFSGWDGSHRGLEKAIKESMNDPDSYEHVETRFKDMQDHILVSTKFRGKNAFGGKVLQTVTAKVDMKGNVIQIIEQ